MTLVAGWIVAAMFPVLPNDPPDIRAITWQSKELCRTAEKKWAQVPGVTIVLPCKKSNGTETIVIDPGGIR